MIEGTRVWSVCIGEIRTRYAAQQSRRSQTGNSKHFAIWNFLISSEVWLTLGEIKKPIRKKYIIQYFPSSTFRLRDIENVLKLCDLDKVVFIPLPWRVFLRVRRWRFFLPFINMLDIIMINQTFYVKLSFLATVGSDELLLTDHPVFVLVHILEESLRLPLVHSLDRHQEVYHQVLNPEIGFYSSIKPKWQWRLQFTRSSD